MAATLRDVARKAGVSIPTVSLILSGRQGMAFKDSTRKAVMEAVKSLSYRPDSIARRTGRASSRRDAIGLLIRSESASHVANSPAYEFICGINDVLKEHNQFLVMVKLNQLAELDGKEPRIIAERFVDGMIVESGLPLDLEQALDRYDIPTIWLNSGRHAAFDCVYPNEVHAGRLVTEHLIAQGHRNIAFIAPPPSIRVGDYVHFSVFERQQGYMQVMAEHGLTSFIIDQNDIAWSDFSVAWKRLNANNSASSPITGIVTHGIAEVLKLRYEMQAMGRKDVAVATADDMHIFRRSWPDICGVKCDRYQMGRSAAEMMLERVDTCDPQPSQVFCGELLSPDGVPSITAAGPTAKGSKL